MTWRRLEFFPDVRVCSFKSIGGSDFYLVIHPDHVTMIVAWKGGSKRAIVFYL
jgi:hypothetical protein